MHEQATIPNLLYPEPGFLDQVLNFFDLEFWRQPEHDAYAKVLGCRFQPSACFRYSAPFGGYTTVTVKEARFLEIETLHGRCEMKVSKRLYDIVGQQKGALVPVTYRLSRLYARDQRIRARPLS